MCPTAGGLGLPNIAVNAESQMRPLQTPELLAGSSSEQHSVHLPVQCPGWRTWQWSIPPKVQSKHPHIDFSDLVYHTTSCTGGQAQGHPSRALIYPSQNQVLSTTVKGTNQTNNEEEVETVDPNFYMK